MPRGKAGKSKTEVSDYRHDEERLNNPPAGLAAEVEATAEAVRPRRKYAYDPHLDPQLMFDPQIVRQRAEELIAEIAATDDLEVAKAKARELQRMQEPWLQWAGKAEHTSFEVETVPLYIHERISTQAILRAVRREEVQKSLFGDPELPLHEAVEAYQHEMDWANRLILGDSLVVMNSLLERERMAGQVQMIYIDPPYGIGYNSNFQPRVDKRDVKDGTDEDLTREPEQIKAYRDTWTLGIHSYLTYLRDRLLLARELLSETGSVFVQIGDENIHHVRELMDEVFGAGNFVRLITFAKTGSMVSSKLGRTSDYLLWYAGDKEHLKYRQLFEEKLPDAFYSNVELVDGSVRKIAGAERVDPSLLPTGARVFRLVSLESSGPPKEDTPLEFDGEVFRPNKNSHWKLIYPDGMNALKKTGRVVKDGSNLRWKYYIFDYPLKVLSEVWTDTSGFHPDQKYVVETRPKVVERCLLMTTDPGDLVLDPTCGSGTTAYVAEQWGRRWITCDTSRVAIFLARQRLLTARYEYYELADEKRGVGGGFKYKTVPHITLKNIANNPEIEDIYARMHPAIEKALADLNAALRANPPEPFEVTEGGRKGQKVDFRKARSETVKLPSGQDAPAGALLEWEVPFDFPEDWPEAARKPFKAFREAKRAMQKEMDDSIARNSEQETLYDQPYVKRGVVRVSGPFTVEAIPPPSLEAMEETPIGGAPEVEGEPSVTPTEHIETLIEQLRKDGVTFPDNKKMVFASLTGCGSGVIHAEGEPANGAANGLKRVAISFGPLYGSITGYQVEDGLREARIGGYDGIIFCGFAFAPEAQAAITRYANPKLRAFLAHIRPDMLMTDDRGQSLLKTTASSQLFTVFGEPDVEVRETGDGYVVELLGVDVYDPVSGTVSSDGAERVAAWFVDTDYDGRTFCVCQAFFPDRSAWQKLGKALKGTLDPEKLDMLSGTTSLPFAPGKHKRVAVKVIDRRGNEVMVVRPL